MSLTGFKCQLLMIECSRVQLRELICNIAECWIQCSVTLINGRHFHLPLRCHIFFFNEYKSSSTILTPLTIINSFLFLWVSGQFQLRWPTKSPTWLCAYTVYTHKNPLQLHVQNTIFFVHIWVIHQPHTFNRENNLPL